MASYNRVILMGNVTRDIELKYLQSGSAVTEMGLAVSDRRKSQTGKWIEETVFVDVTLWGRTAEVASEYLSKGSPVFIEGRLKLDTWETDGQKRSKLRVVGERMQLIGSRGGAGGGGAGSAAGGGARGNQGASRGGRGGAGPAYDESEYGGGPPMREEGHSRGAPAPAADDDIPF